MSQAIWCRIQRVPVGHELLPHQMARVINIQQITNHVIYLYNQLTETSDERKLRNFKQNYMFFFFLGGECTVQPRIY